MSLTNINNDNVFKKGVIGNVRKAQEDSHDMKVMTPNGDLFVVCDGMGGHVGGAKASSIAVSSIIEYLNKEKYDNIPQALNAAVQFANMQIIGYANANPEFRGMGTTACILLLHGNDAYIAHVGDSRIYLYLGKEKQLHRVTKDHSYVQTLVDAGQISDDEAEHHPNKNRILKALGIRPDMSPTIDVVHPKNGDVFMICTDGLNGMICDKTIEQVFRQEMSIEQKGELLINLAMQGENGYPGGQDNCTVELIKIDNSPYDNSAFTSYNPKKQNAPKNPSSGQGTSVNSPQSPQNSQSKNVSKKIMLVVLSLLAGILLLLIIGLIGICTTENKEKEWDKTEYVNQARNYDFNEELVNGIRETLRTKLDAEGFKDNEIKKCIKEFDSIIKEEKRMIEENITGNSQKSNNNGRTVVSETPKSEDKPQQVEDENTDKKSKSNYIIHTVSKGENLTEIARKYKILVSEIKELNGLNNDNINRGQELKIPNK